MASACSVVLANDASGGGLPGANGGVHFRAVRPSSCILMTIVMVAACALVAAGVLVVREYALSAGYRPAVCRVENITLSARDVFCTYCPTATAGDKASRDRERTAACVSVALPCVVVSVVYIRSDDGANVDSSVTSGSRVRAVLHADSLQAAGQHSQCSFSVCFKSRDENLRAVEEFADQWRAKLASDEGVQLKVAADKDGNHRKDPVEKDDFFYNSNKEVDENAAHDNNPNNIAVDKDELDSVTASASPSKSSAAAAVRRASEQFPCFYDGIDASRVIARKNYSQSDVVHCMLWPSLAVVVSAVVFLYLEARRARLTCCGRRQPAGDFNGDTAAKNHLVMLQRNGNGNKNELPPFSAPEDQAVKYSLSGNSDDCVRQNATRLNGGCTPIAGGYGRLSPMPLKRLEDCATDGDTAAGRYLSADANGRVIVTTGGLLDVERRRKLSQSMTSLRMEQREKDGNTPPTEADNEQRVGRGTGRNMPQKQQQQQLPQQDSRLSAAPGQPPSKVTGGKMLVPSASPNNRGVQLVATTYNPQASSSVSTTCGDSLRVRSTSERQLAIL